MRLYGCFLHVLLKDSGLNMCWFKRLSLPYIFNNMRVCCCFDTHCIVDICLISSAFSVFKVPMKCRNWNGMDSYRYVKQDSSLSCN